MPATSADRSALAALDAASDWINSAPLTAAGLRGSVVAVQFCTYSCVNWIRTLPYVRAWASRYRDDGLVVVGVHAPEFAFERDLEGVRRAMRAMRVEHPVVLDNGYDIWTAFDNHYWPALYVTDGEGRVRYEHFGEGAYGETEAVLRGLVDAEGDPVDVDAEGIEEAADWATLASPETYVGAARGERRTDAAAGDLAVNTWALHGAWTVEDESAVLRAPGGSIACRFAARDVNLVLTPPDGGADVGFTVLLDGEPPGDAHGLDVDARGEGLLTEPRLYQVVRQRGAVRERTLQITFDAPGARAYVFTFG
jgi:hypothetical protein